MSVTPVRRKTLGAAIVGTLTLGACADPVASTDLRPEGPPDVLAVLVFNDTVNGAVESATYCKPNDPKRPGKVGIPAYGINPIICPLDGSAVPELTDAWPDAWYVRVMFDELLDPEVETLKPILDSMGNPTDSFTGSLATTQPVTLKCQDVNGNMVDVDYDGYYSPSGNTVTWPLGPSLVIQPIDPTIVPVESSCELTLNETIIRDKDGEPIAPGRDREPFTFKIAPVSVIAVSAAEGDAIDPSVGGVDLDFNVELDAATVFCTDPADTACADDPTRLFSLTPTAAAANAAVAIDGTTLTVSADLLGDQTYTLATPVGFKVRDKCGKESTVAGAPDPFEFSTNPAKFVSLNPGGGSAVAPSKKITISFNQVIDRATFLEGEDFTIAPRPANFAVPTGAGTSIRLAGDYDLNTTYKLTLKNGASITDAYGKQTITLTEDKVTEFTTTKEIAITAQSPASGGTITKAPTSAASIRLTFNQEMVAGSLAANEFSLTRADGSATGITPTVTASGAVVTISAAALPAGSYKFTLNKDATLEDKIVPPHSYTQAAADRVILFTVADAPAAGPAFKCLGAM